MDKLTIVTDRETGRSRGFGFVEMTNSSEADKAVAALNGTELGGRTLTVNETKPKSDRPKNSGTHFSGRRSGGEGMIIAEPARVFQQSLGDVIQPVRFISQF